MPNVKWRHVWVVKVAGRKSPWTINWSDETGRARRLFYRTKEIAEIAKLVKEQELNAWAKRRVSRTWVQLVAEYGMHLAGASPGHRAKVTKHLERFYVLEHPRQSDHITPAMCTDFLHRREQGEPTPEGEEPEIPSVSTRRTERQNLSTFFAWAVQRGYMESNPMEGTKIPKVPKRIARKPEADAIAKLLEPLPNASLVDDPQAWHVLILLGAVTAFRKQVLLNTYFGVSFDSPAAKKLEAKHRTTGYAIAQPGAAGEVGLLFTYSSKTMNEAVCGLPPALNDRVAQRIADIGKPSGRLFPWRHFQRKAWERIKSAAGLSNITFHTLRGVSGTQAAIARAAREASEHLDHSLPEVTRAHYLDLVQVARVVAIGQKLPPLPPLPAYGISSGHLARGGRPALGSE